MPRRPPKLKYTTQTTMFIRQCTGVMCLLRTMERTIQDIPEIDPAVAITRLSEVYKFIDGMMEQLSHKPPPLPQAQAQGR